MSSSQYPPPPTSDYPPIYPATPNNAQFPDGQGPARGPYPQESPQALPKIENINEVLQAHALNANHALNDQRPLLPQQIPHGLPQTHQLKPNRLRKACDSCSIRKVKVRLMTFRIPSMLTRRSAMRLAHHAEHVFRSRFHAPLIDPAVDEARLTDTPKRSRSDG